MSVDNLLSNVNTLGNTLSAGVNSLSKLSNRLSGNSGSSVGTYWKDRLRPASFRGVHFAVLEGQLHFGRRTVVHEYPYRDAVWIEDLGRQGRKISFSGFIHGDDCIAQRERLIKVCEEVQATTGAELVHPTLGRIIVALVGGVTSTEHWDSGRVFEIQFCCIEQTKRIYPAQAIGQGDAVKTAATAAKTATAKDFVGSMGAALKNGLATASQTISTVKSYANQAQGLINAATNFQSIVQSLPGEFGRFIGTNVQRGKASPTTLQGLIAQGVQGRDNVMQASATMQSKAQAFASGNVSSNAARIEQLHGYAASTHNLTESIASAAPAPVDAIRMLTALIAGAQENTPVADLMRRAALVSLCTSMPNYTAITRDELNAQRIKIAKLLTEEMTRAGDQGQDATYAALNTLRVTTAQTMLAASESLSPKKIVNTPLPSSSLVLAHRLYSNPNNTAEMLAQSRVMHPAFMPISVTAQQPT